MKIYTTDGWSVEEGMELHITSVELPQCRMDAALLADERHLNALGPQDREIRYVDTITEQQLGLIPPQYYGAEPTLVGATARLMFASLSADDPPRLIPESAEEVSDRVLLNCVLPPNVRGESYITGVNFAIRPCPLRNPLEGRTFNIKDHRCIWCKEPEASLFKRNGENFSPRHWHPDSGMVVYWTEALGEGNAGKLQPITPINQYMRGFGGFDKHLYSLRAGAAFRIAIRGERPRYSGAASLVEFHADRYVLWDGGELRVGSRRELFPAEDLGDWADMLEITPDIPRSVWSDTSQREGTRITDAMSTLAKPSERIRESA